MQNILLGEGEVRKIVEAMKLAKSNTGIEYDTLFLDVLEKMEEFLKTFEKLDY